MFNKSVFLQVIFYENDFSYGNYTKDDLKRQIRTKQHIRTHFYLHFTNEFQLRFAD